MTKPIWREIVTREVYATASHPRGAYSITLKLACGHEDHRKYSRAPKGSRVRCRQCESNQ